MVVDQANCGAEVNEASQEDPPWRNNFTGKGELADEGEECLFWCMFAWDRGVKWLQGVPQL